MTKRHDLTENTFIVPPPNLEVDMLTLATIRQPPMPIRSTCIVYHVHTEEHCIHMGASVAEEPTQTDEAEAILREVLRCENLDHIKELDVKDIAIVAGVRCQLCQRNVPYYSVRPCIICFAPMCIACHSEFEYCDVHDWGGEQ